MSTNPIQSYQRDVERTLRSGLATEHSYRPALKELIEALGPGVTATNDPKRVACGAPDYVVSRDTGHGPLTIGYVETKDIGVSLDETERSEQLRRYLPSLDNLLLTDYLEFRWYVGGERRLTARLGSWERTRGGRLVIDQAGMVAVVSLLRDFLARQPEPIRTPRDLAQRMARLTHLIRDIIVQSFATGSESDELKDLRSAFTEVLIPDLPIPQFADMFAQTLSYGLFAARINHTGSTPFRRQDAAREIPRTNPFLRRLFNTITGPDVDDEPFIGFVDDLAQLLAQTDMALVLADFGKRTRQEDPVVHFYETFLAAYDPKLRESRGVYYTPEPVVSYIVRSVDHLLRERFGCADGLADTGDVTHQRTNAAGRSIVERMPRVQILDPACGTATFLYAVTDHIRQHFMQQRQAGLWSGYVRSQLLPRIHGFELLIAPYAVAHLKLGMQLAGLDLPESQRKDWAYTFTGDERLGVYLTNTLEQALKKSELLVGRYISEEANAAADIKRDKPILVVLGNPPYSGNSANKGDWIERLVRDYYAVDGKPLGERNPKWLQDDYVKFLRFGQWRIQQTGSGILAFITNHGYLDNPTFRGMRQQLMETFTDIYILNLHGNSKKRELPPEGGRDENVFDIQQGVAIGVFVKEVGKNGPANVHHADLWGPRENKYVWLGQQSVNTTKRAFR